MMPREEVIRLAKLAGMGTAFYSKGNEPLIEEIWGGPMQTALTIRFAELVAAAEREACYNALQKVMVTDHSLRTYKRCLDAIQKLGETKSDAAMEKVK